MNFFTQKLIILTKQIRRSTFVLMIMAFCCFILSGCSLDNYSFTHNISNVFNDNKNQDSSDQTSEIVLPDQIYFMHKDNCSSIQSFKFEGGTLIDVDENGYFMYDNQKYRAYYDENERLTWDQCYKSGMPMCMISYEGTYIPIEIYNGDERLGVYEQNGKRYLLYNIPHSDMFEGYEITPGLLESDVVVFNKAGLVMEDGVIVADVKEYEELKYDIAEQLDQILFDGTKVTDLSFSQLQWKYSGNDKYRIVEDTSEFILDGVQLTMGEGEGPFDLAFQDLIDCSSFYVVLSEDEKHVELLKIIGADNVESSDRLEEEILNISQVSINYQYVDIIEATYDEYFDYYGGKEEAEALYNEYLIEYSPDEIKEVDEEFYNSYVVHVRDGEPFHIWSVENEYQLKYVYVQASESEPEYRSVGIVLDDTKDSLIQVPNSWLKPCVEERKEEYYKYDISLKRSTFSVNDEMTAVNIIYTDNLRNFFLMYGYKFDYEWLP